jgi:hypothetical protein
MKKEELICGYYVELPPAKQGFAKMRRAKPSSERAKAKSAPGTDNLKLKPGLNGGERGIYPKMNKRKFK